MDGINMSLPPGFKFYPTDEELIIHYLKKKDSYNSTNPTVSIIAEINLYKFDPWELPDRALFGESEWFFFSPRERKYPNGARPNRATTSGYWKATGTDKPIISSNGSQCIGVKKALVFYIGRPPKGTKTNWMMYEYRLLISNSHHTPRPIGSMTLDDWVLCRIREKSNTVTRRQETAMTNIHEGSSYCYYDRELFQEKNIVEKINYLGDDIEFITPNESKIVDENRHHLENPHGETSNYSLVSNDQEDYYYHTNGMCSMRDALDTIRRVLSVGAALDEQMILPQNKRQSCSLTSSNSNIFDIYSNY